MPYTINPQVAQDSITEYLRDEYPHLAVIPDGMVDADEYKDSSGAKVEIPTFKDESVKPFIVLWFSAPKRSARGRSFGSYKLDSRYATVDVLVVANNPTDARTLLNDISDRMPGFKTTNGGRVVESTTLWGQARSIDMLDRPTRWATTTRYDFGISAKKIPD